MQGLNFLSSGQYKFEGLLLGILRGYRGVGSNIIIFLRFFSGLVPQQINRGQHFCCKKGGLGEGGLLSPPSHTFEVQWFPLPFLCLYKLISHYSKNNFFSLFFVYQSLLGFFLLSSHFFLILSKIFIMMYEIWQFSLPIDCFTSITYGVGQWPRTTTKHAHFTHLKNKRKWH